MIFSSGRRIETGLNTNGEHLITKENITDLKINITDFNKYPLNKLAYV